MTEIFLQAELESKARELESLKEKENYQRSHYSVSSLSPEVIRMETGLSTKEIFDIVINDARFNKSIRYSYGWAVNTIPLEDQQVFIALMKVRQNYTNLHLAWVFLLQCSYYYQHCYFCTRFTRNIQRYDENHSLKIQEQYLFTTFILRVLVL